MIILPEGSHIYTSSGIWLFYQEAAIFKSLQGCDYSTKGSTFNLFWDMIILPESSHI